MRAVLPAVVFLSLGTTVGADESWGFGSTLGDDRAERQSFAPNATEILTAEVTALRPRTALANRRPLPRLTPVPILAYHVIAKPPPEARYPELFVSPSAFAAQMRRLARHGYHVVTLQQVYNFWHRGGLLPQRPIVLSFDDGFSNWHTVAYRILRRYDWPGTMNLAVGHLNEIDVSVRWVRRLVAAGWELDSHTFTHRDLTNLDSRRLTREIAGSRAKLQKLFHARVNFFCYPYGRYDQKVIAAVRAAGYLGATTTRDGLARPGDRFTLARIQVGGSDTVAQLTANLAALGSHR